MSLKDKCAIVGIGETEFTRHKPRPTLELGLEAIMLALADAGLSPDDIDGIITTFTGPNANEYASNLNIEEQISFSCKPNIGGSSNIAMLMHAASAIDSGLATNVVGVGVHQMWSDKGIRRTWSAAELAQSGPQWTPEYRQSFEYPYGMSTAAHLFGQWARRHMALYGTTSAQMGAVAVACRKHAILNDKAIMKTPMTIEDHQASPILVDPFHLLDFSLQTDGAIAFVVSSAERARDMRQQPVYIMGIGEGHYWTDEIPNKPDFIKTGHRAAAKRAFGMAGVAHKDIDAVEVYDGFTFHVLGFLEDMGFCGIGESGPFVEGGRIELGGELPLNTHGGNLSQAHVVGLNHTSEAVKQLRGQAGKAQVPNAEIILVNNEGRVGSGGVVILRR